MTTRVAMRAVVEWRAARGVAIVMDDHTSTAPMSTTEAPYVRHSEPAKFCVMMYLVCRGSEEIVIGALVSVVS